MKRTEVERIDRSRWPEPRVELGVKALDVRFTVQATGNAVLAVFAHASHARLLLDQYVESEALTKPGNPEALVRDDLRQLGRLPDSYMRHVGIARTKARLACLRGQRDRAVALQSQLLQHSERSNMHLESAHDRYVLGLLIEGNEGSRLMAAAVEVLQACGIGDPHAYMRGYAPELMR